MLAGKSSRGAEGFEHVCEEILSADLRIPNSEACGRLQSNVMMTFELFFACSMESVTPLRCQTSYHARDDEVISPSLCLCDLARS